MEDKELEIKKLQEQIAELTQFKEAVERLGNDVPLGTACIIFVQGMMSGGHPFARKILEMYRQDEQEDDSLVYSVTLKSEAK